MTKTALPELEEYVGVVSAGMDWLANRLGTTDFVVSPVIGASNPDLGVGPLISSFQEADLAYVKQQLQRHELATPMRLVNITFAAGLLMREQAFHEAYSELQDGGDSRPFIFVLAPCLSRSRRHGHTQLQVHRLGDQDKLAEHREEIRRTYPEDWIQAYGLPDQVIEVLDFGLKLEFSDHQWNVTDVVSG